MIISHNIPALMTHLTMKKSNRGLAVAMQRLSSGFKINSAKDDPAGLAIANKLSYQIAGLERASENSSHGVAMIQTAEGALNEVHNMIQRMRELAVYAANGVLTEDDRNKIQSEIDQLVEEVQAVASRTEYNKMKILNGEGARITQGYRMNAAGTAREIDKAISTLLYISDTIQPGRFNYQIANPGRPAHVVGTDPADALGVVYEPGIGFSGGAATINVPLSPAGSYYKGTTPNYNSFGIIDDRYIGSTITIGNGATSTTITVGHRPIPGTNPQEFAPKTYGELQQEIENALASQGIESSYTGGVLNLFAPDPPHAGIQITGDNQLLQMFGLENNINETPLPPNTVVFDVNGIRVNVTNGEAFNIVQQRIYDALTASGFNYSFDNDGTDDFILINSNPANMERFLNIKAIHGSADDINGVLNQVGLELVNDEPIGMPNTRQIISINGVMITTEPGETHASINTKIIEACEYAGISIWTAEDGTKHWISNQAGTNQYIEIKGNAAFLAQFGLVPTGSIDTDGNFVSEKVRGTDAEITNFELRDINGNLISNGTSGLAYKADGNQVTVRGVGGEVINFNIQVLLRPQANPPLPGANTPIFTFGDDDLEIDALIAGAGIPAMHFEFKDYGPIKIQVGPSYNNNVSMHIPKVSAETLGFIEFKGGKMYSLLNYHTSPSANLAIMKMDDALSQVSNVRARLGAFQNRLESTVRSLDIAVENTESSRSRIQDTDMAKEMTRYSQLNVMYQAGLAILGQANMRPQQVLSLLQ